MNGWLHAALCLVVPAVWSVLLHRVFERIEKRSRKLRPPSVPPIDYSI